MLYITIYTRTSRIHSTIHLDLWQCTSQNASDCLRERPLWTNDLRFQLHSLFIYIYRNIHIHPDSTKFQKLKQNWYTISHSIVNTCCAIKIKLKTLFIIKVFCHHCCTKYTCIHNDTGKDKSGFFFFFLLHMQSPMRNICF